MENVGQHTIHMAPSLSWFGRWRAWLLWFRRVTASTDYIPEIDGLRFIAISSVVLCHCAAIVANAQRLQHQAFDVGAKGVELFFTISGFVLAMPFASQYLMGTKRVSLKNYFIRRITRLEPPYLVALLLLAAMKYVGRGDDFTTVFTHFLASAVYVHNFAYGIPSTVSVVAWSLEIEVQFYVLMPLLATVFLVRNTWIRRSVIGAVILGCSLMPRLTHPTLGPPNGSHLLNYLQFFFAGLLLADVYVVNWRNAPPPLIRGAFAWGDLVSLIGWPTLVYLLLRHPQFAHRVFAPTVFLLYLAMFRSVWARHFMRVPEIAIIGGMCYSIYLLHNTVIQLTGIAVARFIPDGYYVGTAFCTAIMVAPVLIVCAAFYRLIEQPCMRRDWPARLRAWVSRHLFIEEEETPTAPAASQRVDQHG